MLLLPVDVLVCRDFYIWTFVYDVSGVAAVTFHYRIDMDGENPLNSIANEVYHSGQSV